MKDNRVINKVGTVRLRYAAVISFLILMLSGGVGGSKREDNSVLEIVEVADSIAAAKPEQTSQGVVDRSVPKIPKLHVGMVNIDTEPTGVTGLLEYGGLEKKITTPFILSDIKVDENLRGRVVFDVEGFEVLEDEFLLSRDKPVFYKRYNLVSKARGRLSVHARPWGYVHIPGEVGRRETPVHGVKLAPGSHQIGVRYPPKGTWARASVEIKPGKSHRCMADFTKSARMWCR